VVMNVLHLHIHQLLHQLQFLSHHLLMANALHHSELLIVKETVFHGLFQIHFHLIAHQDLPLMEMVLAYQFLHHQHQQLQFVLLDSTKIQMEIVNQQIQ